MFYAAHFKVDPILKFRRKKSDESYVSTTCKVMPGENLGVFGIPRNF